jgi:hypothetical protein
MRVHTSHDQYATQHTTVGPLLYFAALFAARHRFPRLANCGLFCVNAACLHVLWLLYYACVNTRAFDWAYWPVLILLGVCELPLLFLCYYALRRDTSYWRRGGKQRAVEGSEKGDTLTLVGSASDSVT